jgi:hypothetical protein
MSGKKTIEEDINGFLDSWDRDQMLQFFKDIIPLFELYDVDCEEDWLRDVVGEDDLNNVRLIRTVYLVSRIADFHASKLCNLKVSYKELWKKMEKHKIVSTE